MKKLVWSLFIAFSIKALAYEEVWKLGEHFLPMEKSETKNLLISKQCYEGSCEALKVLKTVSLKNIPAEKFTGGKNPGAVICTESAKGKIVYLKDLSGNENTFCFFEDKSMVSSSTLAVYASKNDGGKK